MVMGFAVGKVDLRDETERGFAVVGPVNVRRQVGVATEAGGAKRDVLGLVGGEGDGVAHQRFDGLPVVVQAVGAEGLFEGCGHGGSSFWGALRVIKLRESSIYPAWQAGGGLKPTLREASIYAAWRGFIAARIFLTFSPAPPPGARKNARVFVGSATGEGLSV